MTEFIDIEIIKAVIILFFASGLLILSFRIDFHAKERQSATKKRSYEKYYWLAYIALLASIPFFKANSAKKDAEANIKSFKSAKVLRCSTQSNQYRVSKKDGWQRDKYFFIKDSLMIRADKCKEMQ